jgi:hypothetical protein
VPRRLVLGLLQFAFLALLLGLLWHYHQLSFPHWPQHLLFSWHQPFVPLPHQAEEVGAVQTLRSLCWQGAAN